MTNAVITMSRALWSERTADDVGPRFMRRGLALVIDFVATAIHDALVRRSPEGSVDASTYSATAEIERITRELAGLAYTAVGLDAASPAGRRCAMLDQVQSIELDDPLGRLERNLALGRVERDIVRVLVAWSIEPRIGVLIGHVHDALQKTRPTIGALAEILNDPVGVAVALAPSGVLVQLAIVELQSRGPDACLGLDPRIAVWAATGVLCPCQSAEGSITEVAAVTPSAEILERVGSMRTADVAILRGVAGSGRRTLAGALARLDAAALVQLDVRGDPGATGLALLAIRDARIARARLLVRGTLAEDAARVLAGANDVKLAIALGPDDPIPEPLLDRTLALLELELPSVDERAALYRGHLGGGADEAEVRTIAEQYPFNPRQIRRSAAQAPRIGLDAACRLQLRNYLDAVGTRRPTVATWERLVLPEGALATLRALVAQVQQRHRVCDEWGFGRHHSLGHGVKALFFGKSGTGKTLAAEVLARELRMPLYRIDVTRIVSKWIGETEKNLARVFDAADQSRAIVFFDEADSLFGRRTAIETATDRYANMEVNYLLQRIEEYDGVILLATNLKSNMDEGFARRLHFAVEFPEPDAAARARIWRLSLPPGAPVHAEVDLESLAQRFEISGGAIRNVVLGAAYLAAAEGSPIRRKHLKPALMREFAKMDRLYHRAELETFVDR